MATPCTALLVIFVAVITLNQDITVSGATLNLTASTSGDVNEGSSLTLTCTVDGSRFSSDYIYFDSAVSSVFSLDCSVYTSTDSPCPLYYRTNSCYCSSRSNSTPWTFQRYFQEVEVRHGRNWRCRLYNTGETSNTLAINVNGRPSKPRLSPLSTAVLEGWSVTLTCSSQPTSMPVSIRSSLVYTWLRGGSIISGSSSTLTLWNVLTRDSEGNYTCIAKESGKSLSSEPSNEVYVDVQYAPRSVTLSPSTPSYEVRETTGSVSTIRCQADCDPPCLFRWTDKGGNLVGGSGSALQLTSLRREQSGMFTCSASNHLGLATAQVNITVTYPPEVTLTQTEVRLEEGDDVTVLCHVDASPPAVVSWTKDTGQVTLQSSPLLELRGVGEGDAGLYTCSATNRLSSQESPSQASLRVHVTSQQPEGQAETSELSWKASLGIGITVGFVFCGLVAGLLILLLFRRERRSRDMQGEKRTENSYENLDLHSRRDVRDNATYQQFHVYENQDFVSIEGLIQGRQGNASQTEAGAVGQSQNPRAGERRSGAEEGQGRSSRVEGASNRADGRSSKVEGASNIAEGRSNRAKSGSNIAEGGSSGAVGGSSGAEGGSNRPESRSSGPEDKENRRSKAAEKANRRSASQNRETWRFKAEGPENRGSKAEGSQDAKVQESNGRHSSAAQNAGRKSTAAKKEEGKKGGKNQGEEEGATSQGKEKEEKNGEAKEPPIMAEPFYMNTTM